MSPKTILLLAASTAALSLPLVGSAQGYYGQPGGDQSYQPRSDQPYYGQPDADQSYQPRGDQSYQPRGDQPYYGQPDGDQSYQPRGDQSYYGQPRGDWYSRGRITVRGYPEFRQVEAHIRSEINDGVREDLLAPEDAADFNRRLRAIQGRELREYRAHGWNLPDYDRAAIRRQLDALDSLVDQTRDEP